MTPTAFAWLPTVRDHLIEVAGTGGTITYGELREELGLPSPGGAVPRELVVNAVTGDVGSDFEGDAARERAAVYRVRSWS